MAEPEELVLQVQEPVGGREDLDHYPTPRAAILSLIRSVYLPAPGTTVLDPACGEGALLDVLRQECRVETVGIELDKGRAEHARRRGHRVTQADALEAPWPAADHLVGNPPFNRGLAFAERAVAWSEDNGGAKVMLLLRLSFMEPASGRGPFLRATRPNVYVLPERPVYDGRGTDSVTSAWFCWPGEGLYRVLPELSP